ncbi:hypothetical protein [uncultured Dysosmobacter sp.]|uniref:hypothetical protein n=1 Tax=uncultured Dysosmobacter sp. TaxID=2591384 RepID=UPI002609B3DB|nr:hypothetical protein [uncultured Dysosmobacter sp.]
MQPPKNVVNTFLARRRRCGALRREKNFFKVFYQETVPSVNKGQRGFSGHLKRLAALSSLPGGSPAASSALPAAESAPEKLQRTCQREKIGAGKEEDDGGLTPI